MVYFHLAEGERQAYSLPYHTTTTFLTAFFHSPADFMTPNNENLIVPSVVSHSVTATGCFSPF